MPRIGGLLALRELKDLKTTTRILLLTAAIEQTDIVTAFQLGAQGVVLKDTGERRPVQEHSGRDVGPVLGGAQAGRRSGDHPA